MKRCSIFFTLAAVLAIMIPFNAAAEESKLNFSGSLRGRFEGLWYRRDARNVQAEDRIRLRYNLRINAEATLNEHAAVEIGFSSGADDSRSGNQTIGEPVDFGPNGIVIRRAFLIFMPYAGGKLPNRDGHWEFQFGLVPEPFTWKHGMDMMIWDNDYTLGGVNTLINAKVAENASLFGNAGYYVVEEVKSAKNPFLGAVQGGLEASLSDGVKAGVRGSFFHFDYLDDAFIGRGVDGTGGATSAGGNIADGLTGDPEGGNLQVVETQAFVEYAPWSVIIFGGYSSNLSAEASDMHLVDKENTAYNAGIEGGDKKKYAMLGIAYYYIEANAFPSQFIDSDLFDGRTNRKGGLVYAARQLLKGVDFNLKVMQSDAVKTDLPAFEESVKNSKRTRLQADIT
ncbi:MAG: putative porin, partial [Chitinivibrionia bacterium]|nr:putative porin [Chitinivibrionia bacterium]